MSVDPIVHFADILDALFKAFAFTSNEGKRLALDFHDCWEVEIAELRKNGMLLSEPSCMHTVLVFDPGYKEKLTPALYWRFLDGSLPQESNYCGPIGRSRISATVVAEHFPIGYANWEKLLGQTHARVCILDDLYRSQWKLLKVLAEYQMLLEKLSKNKVEVDDFSFNLLSEDYLGGRKE